MRPLQQPLKSDHLCFHPLVYSVLLYKVHHVFHLVLALPFPFLCFLSLSLLFHVYLPCSVCVNLVFCCYSFCFFFCTQLISSKQLYLPKIRCGIRTFKQVHKGQGRAKLSEIKQKGGLPRHGWNAMDFDKRSKRRAELKWWNYNQAETEGGSHRWSKKYETEWKWQKTQNMKCKPLLLQIRLLILGGPRKELHSITHLFPHLTGEPWVIVHTWGLGLNQA